jgi:hypothetical protein
VGLYLVAERPVGEASALLVATGALDSPAAIGLSLSPLGFAGIAYLFGSLGLGRPT